MRRCKYTSAQSLQFLLKDKAPLGFGAQQSRRDLVVEVGLDRLGSLFEISELADESVVGLCLHAGLLDGLERAFGGKAMVFDEVGDHDGGATGNTGVAVDQHVAFPEVIVDVVGGLVEEADQAEVIAVFRWDPLVEAVFVLHRSVDNGENCSHLRCRTADVAEEELVAIEREDTIHGG